MTDGCVDSSTVLIIRRFGTFTMPLRTRLVLVMAIDIQRRRELTGTLMEVLTLVRQSSSARLSVVRRVSK